MSTIIDNLLINKPRILLVDNNPTARISYQSFLMECGFEPILAMGMGKGLQEDARIKAGEHHCQLALVDLHLINDDDENDKSGLEFAEEIKQKVRPILLTGTDDPDVLRDLLQNHRDIEFISKHDRRTKFIGILENVAKQVCASKRNFSLTGTEALDDFWASDLAKEMGTHSDEVLDVFAQIFPKANTLHFEKLNFGEDDLGISSAIRPNSVVLKVYEDGLEPCIVKLARSVKILQEVTNYRIYISRKLTGGFNPHLIEQGIRWNIGGVAYTEISGKNATPFTKYYKHHGIEEVQYVLESFFCESWKKHYSHWHEENRKSLFELYSIIWGDEWFGKCLREISQNQITSNSKQFLKLGIPHPIEWIQKNVIENNASAIEKVKVSVVHGDLHGDNLLVDDNRNIWVIDYERCGEGHIFQDFIELETDIINRMSGINEKVEDFLTYCLNIAGQKDLKNFTILSQHNSQIEKSLKSIAYLRSLAVKCTGTESIREYLWGLMFNMVFYSALIHKEHPENIDFPLLLSGIICHRLEHWGENWPPKEWLSS